MYIIVRTKKKGDDFATIPFGSGNLLPTITQTKA